MSGNATYVIKVTKDNLVNIDPLNIRMWPNIKMATKCNQNSLNVNTDPQVILSWKHINIELAEILSTILKLVNQVGYFLKFVFRNHIYTIILILISNIISSKSNWMKLFWMYWLTGGWINRDENELDIVEILPGSPS